MKNRYQNMQYYFHLFFYFTFHFKVLLMDDFKNVSLAILPMNIILNMQISVLKYKSIIMALNFIPRDRCWQWTIFQIIYFKKLSAENINKLNS